MHRFLALIPPILLISCGKPSQTAGPLNAEVASFLPEDSVLVAGIQLEQLRAVPLYQQYVERNFSDRLNEFARQTGFDPRKDVRELLVASNGEDTVVIARGNFPEKGPEGSTKTVYKGVALYVSDEYALALVDKTTALAGSTGMVNASIDQYKAHSHGPDNLLARVKQFPSRARSGWWRLKARICWTACRRWKATWPTSARS